MDDALRWLRAEFTHRTDAGTALGVRTTISDASVYDHMKVLARFVRLAGYLGLRVTVDEMVDLYRLSNAQPAGQLRAAAPDRQRRPPGPRRGHRLCVRGHRRLPLRSTPRPVLLRRPRDAAT